MDQNRRESGQQFLVTASIIAAVLVVGFWITSTMLAAPFKSRLDRPPEPVTLDMFYRVRTGAPYSEVKEITGREGRLAGHTTVGGIDTQSWEFSNQDGSGMSVMIQEGKVISKAQFGLQ